MFNHPPLCTGTENEDFNTSPINILSQLNTVLGPLHILVFSGVSLLLLANQLAKNKDHLAISYDW